MGLPEIYWATGVRPNLLAFGARPRAGDWLEDEILGYKRLGFRHVVSLLEPSEARELGLADEKSLCEAQGIQFHSLPIPDRGIPSHSEVLGSLVHRLCGAVARDEAIYIHCRAGVGRSGMLTALVMLQLGVPYESVFPSLSQARGIRVPDTEQQEQWVRFFAARGEF